MYIFAVMLLIYVAYQVALRRLVVPRSDGDDGDSEGREIAPARSGLFDRVRLSWVPPVAFIVVLVGVVGANDPSQRRYLLWGLAPIALAFGVILGAMKGWVGDRGSKIGLVAFVVLGVLALAQVH